MNRIDQIFGSLRARGGKALMPFLTAGDPNLTTTGELMLALERAGASICELGIPFSDPIADGPVIQASMTHALNQDVRPADVLELIAQCRSKLTIGLVVMVSYSIVYRLGAAQFVRDAKLAGVDGFIFPDIPLTESKPTRDLLASEGLTLSMMIAPTTPQLRAREIARSSSGFLYLIARSGITGETATLAQDLTLRIQPLRSATDLPVAVGFGISDRDQVRRAVESADAAIVGSAIMRRIAEHRDDPEHLVGEIEHFARDLVHGLG